MIDHLRIKGYRSIRSLSIDLAPLTVVTGANGAGKTNLYRGLELIRCAATGTLARDLAAEGGMPSVLWAGSGWQDNSDRNTAARANRARKPVRLELSARMDHLEYSLSIGLPNGTTEPALDMDPVVREETVTAHAARRKVVMMSRKGPALSARDDQGQMQTMLSDLLMSETALSGLAEPGRFAELALLHRQIGQWRFYHQFRADPASPLRAPQMAITSPMLDSDGANWASALYTMLVFDAGLGSMQNDTARSPVAHAVDAGFPGAKLFFASEGARLEPQLRMPEFRRPFGAGEMSDGTLRYLCLVAALTSFRRPAFFALNEPETSLNETLIEPLAHLIGKAAEDAQIMVVTHSARLAEILDLDYAARVVHLVKDRGETVLDD